MNANTTVKTLLQMAGANPNPGALPESAVVLIDAQREYLDGGLRLDGIGLALEKVNDLLVRARAAGAPVIHIIHQGRPGGLFDLDGPGGQIANEAMPIKGELVVKKALPNSFAGTQLDDLLKATGRKSLILAGFATHMCVSSTARAALDLGYKTTIVADATATRSLPDPLGTKASADSHALVSSADIQRAALAALADRFASVFPLAAILD